MYEDTPFVGNSASRMFVSICESEESLFVTESLWFDYILYNNMDGKNEYLIFTVYEHSFAIPLGEVAKVMQVVEMKSVPQMPKFLHGIINYFGDVRPVINLHYIFSCSPKEIDIQDQMIVLNAENSEFVLLVDSVKEVVSFTDDMVSGADSSIYDKQFIKGVIKLDDGMILINDVKHFLDPTELKQLATALEQNNQLA